MTNLLGVSATPIRPLVDARRFMVDTHAHFYDCFDAELFLNAAIENASRYADAIPCLMLADPVNRDSIGEIVRTLAKTNLDIDIIRNGDAAIVTRDGNDAVVFVRGRQVRTKENLEILAFGATNSLDDGHSFGHTLHQVATNAKLGIVPWSFGKWWGKRRRLLRNSLDGMLLKPNIDTTTTATIMLGDSACRPEAFQFGGSLLGLITADVRVVPGSDPLPLRSESDRAGGFGMLVELPSSAMTSANSANQFLDAVVRANVVTVGTRMSFARLVRQQVDLRFGAHATP